MDSNKTKYFGIFFLLIIIISCNSLRNVSLTEVNYGLFNAELSHRTDNKTSVTGKSSISTNNGFYKTTANVPLKFGIQFGTEFILSSNVNKTIELDIIWKYPHKIKNDKGEYFTEYKINTTRRTNVKTWTGYVINKEYEMVPGIWILEIYQKNKKLYQKKFILE